MNDLRRLELARDSLARLDGILAEKRAYRDRLIITIAGNTRFAPGRRPANSTDLSYARLAEAAGISESRVRDLIAEARR